MLETSSRLLGVAFLVVLTRILEPTQVGRYAVFGALLIFGNTIADFGTTTVLTRKVSRDPAAVGILTSVAIPVSAALGTIAWVGAVGFAIVAGYPDDTQRDVFVGGSVLPLYAIFTSMLGTLDGLGLIALRARLKSFHFCLTLVTGLLFLIRGWGVEGLVWAHVGAALVASVSAVLLTPLRHLWRPRGGYDKDVAFGLLRSSVPFAVLNGISAFALRFDTIVLSLVRTRQETAAYELALRLIEALAYLPLAVIAPLLFLFSRRLGERDRARASRAFREAARLVYLVGLPISVALVVLHDPLAALLFGADHVEASVPLAILGGQLWLAFLAALQGTLISGGDHIRKAVYMAAGVTSVTVTLDLLLVPMYGPPGAAWAAVLAQCVAVTAFSIFIRRSENIATPLPPAGALAGAAGFAAVAAALAKFGLPFAAAAGGTTYIAILVITRTVRRSDVAHLHALFVHRG